LDLNLKTLLDLNLGGCQLATLVWSTYTLAEYPDYVVSPLLISSQQDDRSIVRRADRPAIEPPFHHAVCLRVALSLTSRVCRSITWSCASRSLVDCSSRVACQHVGRSTARTADQTVATVQTRSKIRVYLVDRPRHGMLSTSDAGTHPESMPPCAVVILALSVVGRWRQQTGQPPFHPAAHASS
jgi:hypothetical protein